MNRMEKLLVSAANNLKQGMNPMHHEWLVENEVTGAECMTLCEQMATAIHLYRARTKAAARMAELEGKDRSLAEIVETMKRKEAGPMGLLLEAALLEEQAESQQAGDGT